MSKNCPYCHGSGRVFESPDDALTRAIEILTANPNKEVYEAGDARGKPTGFYFITYTPDSPKLASDQVQEMVARGYLRGPHAGTYTTHKTRAKLPADATHE